MRRSPHDQRFCAGAGLATHRVRLGPGAPQAGSSGSKYEAGAVQAGPLPPVLGGRRPRRGRWPRTTAVLLRPLMGLSGSDPTCAAAGPPPPPLPSRLPAGQLPPAAPRPRRVRPAASVWATPTTGRPLPRSKACATWMSCRSAAAREAWRVARVARRRGGAAARKAWRVARWRGGVWRVARG
eukprot:5358036-Prymnesium_polylepis.1